MSHFTVLVVGDNPEKQLEPFNEQDEKYINYFNDCTEEVLEKWNGGTRSEFYCSSNSSWGMRVDKDVYNDIKNINVNKIFSHTVVKEGFSYFQKDGKYRLYYREDDNYNGGDIWVKCDSVITTDHPNSNICFNGVIFLQKIDPPKKIKFSDQYDSIDNFAEEWFGYEKNNNKYGYYNNKNAKWDWYSLGGRWAGFFKLKLDTEGKQGHHAAKECTKIDGTHVEDLPVYKVDQCKKGDIDIEGMKLEAKIDALLRYQEFIEKLGDNEMPPKWNEFREKFNDNINEAKKQYNSLKSVETLRKGKYYEFQHFLCTEKEYVNNAVNNCLTTFAVLKDGKWYERGEMGWWGITMNKKENDVWNEEFMKMFENIPDNTLVSVYDCHI